MKGFLMRTLASMLLATSLMFGVPGAFADSLTISPEIGVKFHDDVKVKKYRSHKWDGDARVGVVVPEDIDEYDIPEDVVVATPALKRHKYVYLNDRVYIVDNHRRIVTTVE